MTFKQFTDTVFENWPSKVICFFLAILLYFSYQIVSLDTKSISVPLTVTTGGKLVSSGTVPRSVRITLKGSPANINQISENDIVAYLDTDSLSESGTYKLPVQLDLSSNLMIMDPLEIEVKPQDIQMQLEEKVFEYVKIIPTYIGDVAEGYEVVDCTFDPIAVQVTGPKSLVEATKTLASDGIKLEGKNSTFAEEVKIKNSITRLSIDTNSKFFATVVIQPKIATKIYSELSIDTLYLPETFRILSSLPKVTIELSGAELILKEYVPNSSFIQADFSGINESGIYEVPLRVFLPSDLSIKTMNITTVQVELEEIPVIEEDGEETENSGEKTEESIEENL